MEYIGQTGWLIRRGAAEFKMPAHLTNIFHIGRLTESYKIFIIPSILIFSSRYLDFSGKTIRLSYHGRTRTSRLLNKLIRVK